MVREYKQIRITKETYENLEKAFPRGSFDEKIKLLLGKKTQSIGKKLRLNNQAVPRSVLYAAIVVVIYQSENKIATRAMILNQTIDLLINLGWEKRREEFFEFLSSNRSPIKIAIDNFLKKLVDENILNKFDGFYQITKILLESSKKSSNPLYADFSSLIKELEEDLLQNSLDYLNNKSKDADLEFYFFEHINKFLIFQEITDISYRSKPMVPFIQ